MTTPVEYPVDYLIRWVHQHELKAAMPCITINRVLDFIIMHAEHINSAFGMGTIARGMAAGTLVITLRANDYKYYINFINDTADGPNKMVYSYAIELIHMKNVYLDFMDQHFLGRINGQYRPLKDFSNIIWLPNDNI